jgi:hypothetical protein
MAAFSNINWDLGNEHNFHREVPTWCDGLGPMVKGWDPYDHLCAAHNIIYRTPGKCWNDMQLIQRWDSGQNAYMLGERAKQAATGRVIPQINEEYGYEDLWEKYPGQRAADTRRRCAWEVAMAGCYQTTGETAERGTGSTPDTGGGWVNGRGDDTMTMLQGYVHMVDFFAAFDWWKCAPSNTLLRGGALCLTEPGMAYALYLPASSDINLILPTGSFRVRGFNPRTGAWSDLPPACGPVWATLTPSGTEDWAYLLQRDTDPYHHHIVLHTYPNMQDRIYPPLLGDQSPLTGVSLQNSWNQAHQRTLKWVVESERANKPWVVAHDEQNPAGLGVPQDPGYKGTDGVAVEKAKKIENATTGDVKSKAYTLHDIRKLCLWGTLMAGGAGVEYYFGYQLPENDLACEDWRSRDRSWEYCRNALAFFTDNRIPFWEMRNADGLIGNPKNTNEKYCLARTGSLYLVYLPSGGSTELDLTGTDDTFTVSWYNPREGGALLKGTIETVTGGGKKTLGAPPQDPAEDWLIVVRK